MRVRVIFCVVAVNRDDPVTDDDIAFADCDARGNLLGVELLGPCEIRVLDQIARKEPIIRRFVRENIPSKLVPARAS